MNINHPRARITQRSGDDNGPYRTITPEFPRCAGHKRVANFALMRIDLSGTISRLLFGAMVFPLAALLIVSAGAAWLAEHWDGSTDPRLWLRAARLEPASARYWEHLGLYEQWDLLNGGPRQAAADLERAARANSASSRIWLELASAYETMGDAPRARQAYRQAQADYPASSEAAFRYGSFLFRQRDFISGFEEIRRALLVDSSLASSAMAEAWAADPDIDAILASALPAKQENYVPAIQFFLDHKQFDAALAVWARLLKLGDRIEMGEAIPLDNALITQDRLAEARQVWRQALEAAEWPHDRNDSGSFVFNGGFEHDLAQGGFDWRESSIQGARFALDRGVAYSGSRSARIEFDGSANLDYQNLVQYVSVQPGSRYRLLAYLRTDGISTDCGIHLAILDLRHLSQPPVVTSDLTGTNPWTLVQADVATGPGEDLLGIAVQRVPSRKFDNKLHGAVWIDDVSLVPLAGRVKSGPR